MIKSDAQRDRTRAQIEGFRRALVKADEEKPGKRSAAIRGSYESMIRQLEDELREYDGLKSGVLDRRTSSDSIKSRRSSQESESQRACRKRNWPGDWAL